MQDTIITWNLENWVTVILMAALGFAILGFGMSFIKKQRAAKNTPAMGGGQAPQAGAGY